MTIPVDIEELQELLSRVAELAVATYIREQAPAKDRISQNKAYKMFGESRVKGWVERGQILPIRDGHARTSTRYYSMADLKTLEASEKMRPMINRRRRAV